MAPKWLITSGSGVGMGGEAQAPLLQLEKQRAEDRGDRLALEERLLCLAGSGHCVFTDRQTQTSDNRTGSTVSAAGRGERANCIQDH